MLREKTLWSINKVVTTISPELFQAFIRGHIPGFKIPKFLDLHEAAEIAESVAPFIEEYANAKGVGKAGPTLVEHPDDFPGYAALGAVQRSFEGSLPQREYLVHRVCGFLTVNTGFPFRVLHHGNVPCFYGLFRKINNGAGAHVDIVSEDNAMFKNRVVKFQASIVLHLQVPEKGGETIIWNRQWEDADKAFLLDSWQHDESMFADDEKVEVKCVAGELVILATTNFHKVNPSEGNSNRISFSMFTVIFEDEPEVIYIYN